MVPAIVAIVVITSVNCVGLANAIGIRALAEWGKNDYATAAHLEERAANGLEGCLAHHPPQWSKLSLQRVGELYMYAGEYSSENADWRSARLLLTHAEKIFTRLRTVPDADRSWFDVILLDAHQAERDCEGSRKDSSSLRDPALAMTYAKLPSPQE